MNFFQAVGICFTKYATFTGRARRAEYWWFFLFTFLASFLLAIFDEAAGVSLSGAFSLAVFIPAIAVTARRLHDTGRSGWWQLLVLVPLIGVIVLLVWLVTRGKSGPNAYGGDPLVSDNAGESAQM